MRGVGKGEAWAQKKLNFILCIREFLGCGGVIIIFKTLIKEESEDWFVGGCTKARWQSETTEKVS